MTLHEAIRKLLVLIGRPMTTREIADGLNKNKWYEKKGASTIAPFQIHGRTKSYPHLFERDGSSVSLVEQSTIKESSIQSKKAKYVAKPIVEISTLATVDTASIEKN